MSALRAAARKFAHALRLRGPLAGDPTARILHALVICILIWMVPGFAVAIPFSARKAAVAVLCTFEAAVAFCSWVLLRRGRIRPAGLVYLAGTCITATVVVALSGGIRSPALVLYVALPISAAWLLGYRATIWGAAACLVISLWMALMDMAGKPLPRFFPGNPAPTWFVVLLASAIGTVPVANLLRILREALETSQRDKQALRREHDLMTRIMETSPVGIIAFNRIGEVQFANVNAQRTLGLTDDADLRQAFNSEGLAVFDTSGRRLRNEQRAAAQVIATGKPVYGARYWIERNNGERILISVNAAPLLGLAGELEGVVAAMEDITERTRAAEELRQHKEHLQELVEQRTSELVAARDDAQAANRAKSAFLAKMSHELRTPLSAILGFSSLLSKERTLSDRQRGDLDVINRSGGHLLELINELLDVFKIEAGRTVVETCPLDLTNLVGEVMGLMRVRAEEKGLKLVLESLPDAAKYIRSDSAKLRQILINLVGNAIKYTEKGSVRVRVQAQKVTGDESVLLMIDVADTGIGIAAEDQVRIFDPFVQGSNFNSPSGTGLGLSISAQFLQLMGGNITVESTPGIGSVFHVCLPVALCERSELDFRSIRRERVLRIAPGQRECRVLVVEDDDANARFLQRVLEDAGFRVLLASNGAEGVQAFRDWRPHFIWIDRQMPIMNGLEAVREIRAIGGSDVKIAAVSASLLPLGRDELMGAGLDDFVCKPLTAEVVCTCMARHLNVHFLVDESPSSPASDMKPLEPEALAAMPEDLRNELENALICLDVQRINSVIDRIADVSPGVGPPLSAYASRFAFTSMLRALQLRE